MDDDAASRIQALEELTAEVFEALVGETLTLADDADGQVDLTLARVSRKPAAQSRTDVREPFSLLLHGPGAWGIEPGCYFLCHSTLPGLPPVHITPVIEPGAPADEDGRPLMAYQIVMN